MSPINVIAVIAGAIVTVPGITLADSPAPGIGRPANTILLHNGDRVAFLGASITDFGWTRPGGYLKIVVSTLAANGVDILPIPAGRGGNTSSDMLARVDRDVIDQNANWVTIDAGGNDVWHNSVQFPEYMSNMTAIVDKCQAAGIHVVIQTCTPLFEDVNNAFNTKLAYYNDFLRYLAAQKGCVLADLNAQALAVLSTKKTPDNILTVDGVHMNDRGNQLMAAGLLASFGLPTANFTASTPPDKTQAGSTISTPQTLTH